jgi:hypothetical protein
MSREYGVRLEGGNKRSFETRKRNKKSGVSKGKKRKGTDKDWKHASPNARRSKRSEGQRKGAKEP